MATTGELGVRAVDGDGEVVAEWPGLRVRAGELVQLEVSAGVDGERPAAYCHFLAGDSLRDGWRLAWPAEGEKVTAAVRRAGGRHTERMRKAVARG